VIGSAATPAVCRLYRMDRQRMRRGCFSAHQRMRAGAEEGQQPERTEQTFPCAAAETGQHAGRMRRRDGRLRSARGGQAQQRIEFRPQADEAHAAPAQLQVAPHAMQQPCARGVQRGDGLRVDQQLALDW